MPDDFSLEDRSLNKLKVTVRNGVIFASFDCDVEPFEDYLVPDILQYFNRTFDGRKLTRPVLNSGLRPWISSTKQSVAMTDTLDLQILM